MEHTKYPLVLHATAQTPDFDIVKATTLDRTKFGDAFHTQADNNRHLGELIAECLR